MKSFFFNWIVPITGWTIINYNLPSDYMWSWNGVLIFIGVVIIQVGTFIGKQK